MSARISSISSLLWTFSKHRYYASVLNNVCRSYSNSSGELQSFREKVAKGPSLHQFVAKLTDYPDISPEDVHDVPPYITLDRSVNQKRTVYIETYGCQMNVSDTEVITAILQKAGYQMSQDISEADVIFLMTCAIREGAEQKIWNRLKYFRNLRKKKAGPVQLTTKIGILGCMAERLKHKILEKEKIVDIVAGPDSYRDLPHLISLSNENQTAVNVMLSVDETYADIFPIRTDPASKSAFVSIMRGCDNMCTYCIVPFTRGKERSRPVSSILDEIRHLSDQGYKEVTLLGQNVNSYRDLSELNHTVMKLSAEADSLSKGFHTVYRTRYGGLRFADLLDKVSNIDPDMRIRFTSPHPKDFPDEVLKVIKEKPNICKLLHMPAQSGNSRVLERMRRGYTRESYLELIEHVRQVVPGIAFTSDFICGFCGETEEEHRDTLSMIENVQYEFAFVFPYSMREKTRAYHRLKDDVPDDVKKRRANEALDAFRKSALDLHKKQIGKEHLVQVLGPSKRSELEWSGRNDWNTKVIFPYVDIPVQSGSGVVRMPSPGDYVMVKITDCSSQVLKGNALYHTSLSEFNRDAHENSC